MPREMEPMMAVAQEEAMHSVEGSHFANGRRHCCYQIGLEKTSKGFNEDVKNYLHVIFVYYSTLPDCARGRYKNIGQPFRKTTSLNKKHCAQLQKKRLKNLRVQEIENVVGI